MIFNSLSASAYYLSSHIKSAAIQIGNFVSDSWCGSASVESLNLIAAKLVEVAKKTFVVIASLALLIINPGVFTISFAVGFIFDDHIRALLERVRQRIGIQPWHMALAVGCGALVSLPVSLAVLSSMWALHLGSKLSFDAQVQLQEINTTQDILVHV